LWNRSLQVVIDLLGVFWLMRRPLCSQVIRTWDLEETMREPESQVIPPLVTVCTPARHRQED
jgi:hypothetical protein